MVELRLQKATKWVRKRVADSLLGVVEPILVELEKGVPFRWMNKSDVDFSAKALGAYIEFMLAKWLAYDLEPGPGDTEWVGPCLIPSSEIMHVWNVHVSNVRSYHAMARLLGVDLIDKDDDEDESSGDVDEDDLALRWRKQCTDAAYRFLHEGFPSSSTSFPIGVKRSLSTSSSSSSSSPTPSPTAVEPVAKRAKKKKKPTAPTPPTTPTSSSASSNKEKGKKGGKEKKGGGGRTSAKKRTISPAAKEAMRVNRLRGKFSREVEEGGWRVAQVAMAIGMGPRILSGWMRKSSSTVTKSDAELTQRIEAVMEMGLGNLMESVADIAAHSSRKAKLLALEKPVAQRAMEEQWKDWERSEEALHRHPAPRSPTSKSKRNAKTVAKEKKDDDEEEAYAEEEDDGSGARSHTSSPIFSSDLSPKSPSAAASTAATTVVSQPQKIRLRVVDTNTGSKKALLLRVDTSFRQLQAFYVEEVLHGKGHVEFAKDGKPLDLDRTLQDYKFVNKTQVDAVITMKDE